MPLDEGGVVGNRPYFRDERRRQQRREQKKDLRDRTGGTPTPPRQAGGRRGVRPNLAEHTEVKPARTYQPRQPLPEDREESSARRRDQGRLARLGFLGASKVSNQQEADRQAALDVQNWLASQRLNTHRLEASSGGTLTGGLTHKLGLDPTSIGANFLREAEMLGRAAPAVAAEIGGAVANDAILAPIREIRGDDAGGSQILEFGQMAAEEAYRYGKDRYVDPIRREGFVGGLKEIGADFQERPLTGLLDATFGAGLLSRGLSVGGHVVRGKGPIEAVKASAYPLEPRTLRLGTGKRRQPVYLASSRSPLGRWFEGLYDNFSRQVDDLPGLGPKFGETKRAGRIAERELRRDNRRLRAAGASHARQVHRISFPSLGGKNKALRTRLWWEANVPAHLRGDDHLRRVIDDLRSQLHEPLPMRDLPETPALQRARARVEHLQKQYDASVGKRDERTGATAATDASIDRDALAASLREADGEFRRLNDARNAATNAERTALQGEWDAANGRRRKAANAVTKAGGEVSHTAKGRVRVVWRSVDEVRIAKSGHDRGTVERLGAALSVERDKLALLERRQARKKLKKDLAGLREIREELRGKLEKTESVERAALLEDQIDRIDDNIAEREQMNQLASERREENIKARIAELEEALAVKPDKRYDAAIEAAGFLTEQREQILRDLFADDPDALALLDERLEGRRALLGSYLYGDETPSDIYVRHSGQEVRPDGSHPSAPANRVFGKTDTSRLGLTGSNELVRYRTGALNTDPDVLIETWTKALSFKHIDDTKKFLASVGEEIPLGGAPKPGWYIVNTQGRMLPRWWKEAEMSDDGFVNGLREFGGSILRKEGTRGMDDLMDIEGRITMEGVYQVDPRIVHAMFGRWGKPGSQPGPASTAADVVNGLVRTSLLYANPGYIPANLVGNLVFLGAQQPALAIPNLYRSAKVLAEDKPRADLIRAEIGHGPSVAIAPDARPGGRGLAQRTLQATGKIGHFVGSLADDWPRMAAWVYEARRKGYRTREQQMRLLQAKDAKTKADRTEVTDRAERAMVDFDRMGPDEKRSLARVLFVWPWIRGSSAWAARFPLEHPELAGALAPAASAVAEDTENTLGKLKPYLSGAFPMGDVADGKVSILNLGPISPWSTLVEGVQTASGVVESFFGDEPPAEFRRLADYLHPAFGAVWRVLESEDSFGTEVSQREAVVDNLRGLSPLARLGEDLASPDGEGVYPEDATRLGRLKRAARVLPYDINLEKAQVEPEDTTPEAVDAQQEWIAKMEKAFGQPVHPDALAALELRTQYRLARENLKDQIKDELDLKKEAKLTDKQNLILKLDVLATLPNYDEVSRNARQELQGESDPELVKAIDRWVEEQLGWSTVLAWYERHRAEAEASQQGTLEGESLGGEAEGGPDELTDDALTDAASSDLVAESTPAPEVEEEPVSTQAQAVQTAPDVSLAAFEPQSPKAAQSSQDALAAVERHHQYQLAREALKRQLRVELGLTHEATLTPKQELLLKLVILETLPGYAATVARAREDLRDADGSTPEGLKDIREIDRWAESELGWLALPTAETAV